MSDTPEVKEEINIQLGDIINIDASSNQELHEQIFVVKYLDSSKLSSSKPSVNDEQSFFNFVK